MAIDIDLDIDELFDIEPDSRPAEATMSPADALIRSFRVFHRVDMPYIARLSGLYEDEAAEALDGSVFLDPELLEWQTSGEYLSGNLGDKLEAAESASAQDEFYARNVAALKKAMPPRVPASEIYASLGSPWIPEDVIIDFIHHIIPASDRMPLFIVHDQVSGSWTIENKSVLKSWPGSVAVWGTKRMPALTILERSLNGCDCRVYDEEDGPHPWSAPRRILNHPETMAALEKQHAMAEEFQRWLWTDFERRTRLEDIFNRNYCTFACQRFDGSQLEFPGMSPEVELRPYQKDAVMRILLRRSVLLAHDVGAGKTYTCIAAGMEFVRTDPTEKVLFVVPNNVLGQWETIFSEMYPQADVLAVHPKSFCAARRQKLLERIRDERHDAIIMAHSSFDLIPLSRAFKFGELDAHIAELNEALADKNRATVAVKIEQNACKKRRKKLDKEPESYSGICFDELGVTRLFVDEAHNYKNLSCGRCADMPGIAMRGSKKCEHMLDAVRCVTRAGGGVVFATGTVLTNSIADCYTFQRYLQPGTLSGLDVSSFDAWCGMFAQKRTSWEVDVDASSFRLRTHFCGFGNLDVLSSLLGFIADFHHMAPGDDLPECKGRTNVTVKKTPELSEYLAKISKRADKVRKGRVLTKDDNLLKICSDGRKAALDVRLVMPDAQPGFNSKVSMCAATVARIWRETSEERLTQLVFCDISTPRAGFNMYDELKWELTLLGVPEEEIAFVHDAANERKRAKLFEDVREGRIRVLVGSTAKLGLGVNVQDRLCAVHHMDVPWKPSDMSQREGRILRQGNMNREVKIIRYVTEYSFDAYSWQLLERKQRVIDELLSGTYEGGWLGSDVGEIALSYGEIKALAVGNPLLRERVELSNELERTQILHRKSAAARLDLAERIPEIVASIKAVEGQLAICADDAEFVATRPAPELGLEERIERGSLFLSQLYGFALRPTDCVIGTYRGFMVVVPAGMMPEHPRVLLQRMGSWPVDMKEAKARGVLTRLDNTLKGLSKRREELAAQRAILYSNKAQAERELAGAGGDLAAKIEKLKARLAQIDFELEEKSYKEAV